MRTENRQTDREFNYRGHSYPLWIVGGAGQQVAGASFGGLLLICLLTFTLNKKSLAYSLQFGSKYHLSLDSLRAQITEHTKYNYVTVALYYVGEKLENS